MPHCSDRPGTEYPVIRPAFFLALFVLFMFVAVLPAAAGSAADDAEALRSFLESHYGVIIRMGDECTGYPSGNYDIRIVPEGSTPFQQIAAGNSRFADLLRTLDDVFSVYPPEFFSPFSDPDYMGGLRFLLVDEIRMDGVNIAGVMNTEDAGFNIFLARRAAGERAIHHEIWHAMESRIGCNDPHAFDDWFELNPEDFLYAGDYGVIRTGEENLEPDDWFVREYSKIDEAEDRATVFEALMTKEEDWWSSRLYLRRKAQFLMEKAEPVFGDLFAGE